MEITDQYRKEAKRNAEFYAIQRRPLWKRVLRLPVLFVEHLKVSRHSLPLWDATILSARFTLLSLRDTKKRKS